MCGMALHVAGLGRIPFSVDAVRHAFGMAWLPRKAMEVYGMGIRLLFCLMLLASVVLAAPAGAAQKSSGALEPLEAVGDYVNDAATTAAVKARLAAEKGLDSSAISVTTEGAVVELTGTVHSAAESAAAERVARGVSNVKDVRNRLGIPL